MSRTAGCSNTFVPAEQATYYSNDPDRAMSLTDWIYLDQANYDLVRYGIEGEDGRPTAKRATRS